MALQLICEGRCNLNITFVDESVERAVVRNGAVNPALVQNDVKMQRLRERDALLLDTLHALHYTRHLPTPEANIYVCVECGRRRRYGNE